MRFLPFPFSAQYIKSTQFSNSDMASLLDDMQIISSAMKETSLLFHTLGEMLGKEMVLCMCNCGARGKERLRA